MPNTTRLSDVIIPEVYASYDKVDDMAKTAFYQSGIITQNADLDAKAKEGGHNVNLPFWKDLDASSEPNISSDDPSVIAEADKVTAGKQVAYKAHLNKPFSAADLTGEIAGSEPMTQIRARFSVYWVRQYQKRLIATAQGVLADNIANGDSDMVFDASVDDAANITSKELFSATNFTGATFTLGDAFSELGAIAMHSMVYKRAVDNNEVETIRASDNSILFRAYKGLRIVLDDSMPVVPTGTGTGFKYTSVIFGAGAFGYGAGSPAKPVEPERDALAGNGGGIETLIERKTLIIHPFGYKAEGGADDNGHTLAELKSASTWSRVVDRKNVPLAFLITNG